MNSWVAEIVEEIVGVIEETAVNSEVITILDRPEEGAVVITIEKDASTTE